MITFELTKEEWKWIAKIAARAIGEVESLDFQQVQMDIAACHENCPLDLQQLYDSSKADFIHDVLGIRSNIDRTTGELRNCFDPRCALPEVRTD